MESDQTPAGSSTAEELPVATEPVTLPWQEAGDREFKDIFASGLIVVLLAMSVVGFVNAYQGDAGNQLGSGILALALAAIGAFAWYGPFGGGVGARVSVDEEGLWVRHWGWRLPNGKRIEFSKPKHLPAAEIGEIELLHEEARSRLWRQTMSLRFEGKLIGWSHNNVDREARYAVLIEQTGDLKRPWWLLRCRQCPELIEALKLARGLDSES